MESMSRPPHRRKHPTATNASSSSSPFSLKNPYDDVLLYNGGKAKFGAHEYAEIFSGSSSIPVLDLSGLDERVVSGGYRSSKLDYSSIFGGLRDDEVAVPYEELVNGAQNKTKTRIPADSQSPYQESVPLHPSRKTKRSSGDASIGEIKQHSSVSFNKTSPTSRDPSNGENTHIAQLHDAVPGFTFFVDGTLRQPKTEGSSSMKREVSRTWSFTAGIEEITVKCGLIPEKSRAPDKSCDLNEMKLNSHIPLFDEELDENSVAAVSAAALKKAIEQAQESIRIAKMIMERKKEGLLDGSILRSKCRLRKDNKKIRTDREAERVRENVGAAKEHGDALTEVGKKFVPSCNPTETSYVAEKVDLENVGQNVSANEACRDAELVPNSSADEALEHIAEPLERVVNCSPSTQEEEKTMRKAGEHLTELKLEFSNCLLNKSGSLAEKHMLLEQEDIEKNYENVPDLKENCMHGKSTEEEVSETEPDIFPEIGKKVNGVHELEIDEKKLKCGHDGDGQKLREEYEQNEIAERHLKCLAAETIHTAVDAHSYDSGVSDTHSNDTTSTIYSETQEHYEVKGYKENDSLRRCASEESFIVSTLNDGFEGLSSDSKTENVGLMDGHHEQALPEDEDTSKTAGEAHNEAAEFDHTNVMGGTLENKEGSISTHGSREFAENAKDITSSKEELKNDIDMTSDEREYVKEQNERDQNLEKNKEHFKEQKDSKRNEQKFETDDQQQRIESIKRGRERDKDRIAVERAIREARERAFAEARERAERERAAVEARQRVKAEAREMRADKVSIEVKLRAERAAVERATAEARERALEKARSQKTSTEGFYSSSKSNGLKHSFSSSDLEKYDGTTSESAERCKARLERHQRIMERSAKALAEKNIRDFLAQKEQAERNRVAEFLDADIKRWVTGKEGNLRALLSTLQYILGRESGWQAISLTEMITSGAVKKAYRKATLCVHPDKLQQRRASIQQKYICEKVFDLLKAAWNRFNSEER